MRPSAARSGEESGLLFPIYVSLCGQRAESWATLGDFPQALASATEALRMATEIPHPVSLAGANLWLGIVHLLRGNIETAVPFLERSLEISREEALSLWFRSRESFAYALVCLGERERGLEYLARMLEQLSGDLMPRWERYGTLTAGVYLAAGCVDEARAEIRQGLAAAIEQNARGYLAPLRRLEAEMLSAQTPPEPAAALERLREAVALAAELGMRPEVAHCHLGLGKLYRRTGKRQEAQEHLVTATTMYREMAMRFWLEQAEAEAEMRELAAQG